MKQGRSFIQAPEPATGALPAGPDFTALVLDLHRALGFQEVWSALQRLMEGVVPHDTMVMSMNYLDWRREASLTRLVSDNSRVSLEDQARTDVAGEGRSFFQPYLEVNPGLATYRHTQIIDDPRAIERTAFYQRCMIPFQWRYSAHLLIWREGGVDTSIALRRRFRDGDFSDGEMHLLHSLHPHIATALERVRAYETERQRRRVLESHYAANPEAALFLNWDGHLLYASDEAMAACCRWNLGPAAARCYSYRKTFSVPSDIVESCEVLRERWLAQETGADGRRASLMMPVDNLPSGQTAVITLRHNGTNELERPVFVVRLTPKPAAAAGPVPSPEHLRVLLSPAERELADLVCQGLSNREVAAQLSKAEGSVKVQLSNIYQKLGVRNRTQMVLSLKGAN